MENNVTYIARVQLEDGSGYTISFEYNKSNKKSLGDVLKEHLDNPSDINHLSSFYAI